ncbi:Crp/Fnr family transcriptional regulator [Shewanella sp.]
MVVARDILITQGQAIKELYWVESGVFSVSFNAENGRRFNFGRLKAHNRLLGEIEWLTGCKSQFEVCAEESMDTVIIPLNVIEALITEHACIGLWLSQNLSNMYSNSIDFTLEQLLYPLSYNLAIDLKYQQQGLRPTLTFQQFYREAERFGCSERVFRRVVAQLQTLGLIAKIDHHIQVLDMVKLDAFIDSMEK